MRTRLALRVLVTATLAVAAVVALSLRLDARDVYRNFLDPGIPNHRAILDTLALLESTPNDPGLHNDLGCLIARDGFWRDALREFSTAADLDKQDGRPLFNAGLVHAWKSEWSSARGSFRKAVGRDGGNWPGWWMLGYAEERLGNTNAAVDAYKISLRVDTSLFDVKRNPFAADSKLKARVLMETLDKRLVKAAMPSTEQLADGERVGSFFQRARPAVAAPATRDEPVYAPGPQGPVITSVPVTRPATAGAPSRSAPSRGFPEAAPEPSRNNAGPGGAEPETVSPGTTAAPPSTVVTPGPGGG